MTQANEVTERTRTIGDAAVDGLFYGGVAGAAMAAYLAVAGLAAGEPLGAALGRFDPGGAGSPVTGALAHLAVAGVYGALYAIARRWIMRLWARLPGWLLGLAFGVLLLAVANGVFLPLTDSALTGIPAAHFFVAHLLYGLALGALAGRRVRRPAGD
jgi:hypothetical protein